MGAPRHAIAFVAALAAASPASPLLPADLDFRRGDANGDGPVDIADAVATLGFLFQGGALVTCLDAADANDDGEVNLTDAVATLGMLFLGAPALPAPGPRACGPDPSDDALGCERHAPCPPGGAGNVSLELAAAAAAIIGPAGGTLETTAVDGTRYRLSIPEDSLLVGTEISMTPVTGIASYPLADGVAAGVEFAPAGLAFAAPALLTVQTVKTPPAGSLQVALGYEGDAQTYRRAVFGSGAGTILIPIEHFSGMTIGFVTAAGLAALIRDSTVPPDCLLESLPPLGTEPPDVPAAVLVYRICFQEEVLPALEQADTEEELTAAIGKLNFWTFDSRTTMGMPEFDDEIELALARAALVPRVREAIAGNNEQCRTNQSFLFMDKVLFWQRQAHLFGIDTPANFLDRANILRDLCVQPVVENAALAADLQVGFPHSLDLSFGIQFGGQAEPEGAPFQVQITADGLAVENPTGFSNLQGEYTTVVTATRQGVVSLTARACFVPPGTSNATDVCVTTELLRGGQDLTGLWRGTLRSRALDPDGAVSPFPEEIELELDQNQNAISGTLRPCPDSGDVGVPFAATLSGNSLSNLSLGFVVPLVCLLEGAGTVSGDTITFVATGTCLGHAVEDTVEVTRSDEPRC